MSTFPKDSKGNEIEVTEKNGFKKAKALPITRLFLLKQDYVDKFGNAISSLEKKNQNIAEDTYAIFFDNYDKKIGYPVQEKFFKKYDVTKPSKNGNPGIAVKNDNTEFLAKQINEPFTAVIWDGSTLPGKSGDYLVAIPSNKDYRVIAQSIFPKSYKFKE